MSNIEAEKAEKEQQTHEESKVNQDTAPLCYITKEQPLNLPIFVNGLEDMLFEKYEDLHVEALVGGKVVAKQVTVYIAFHSLLAEVSCNSSFALLGIYQCCCLHLLRHSHQCIKLQSIESDGLVRELRLESDHTMLTVDGSDALPVVVRAVDAYGNTIPYAHVTLQFGVEVARMLVISAYTFH